MNITVLGDGAFGTALAQLCAINGHDVALWCYDHGVARMINRERINERYLPSIVLHEKIKAVTSIQEALEKADWIIEAIPVKFMDSVLGLCRPYVQVSTPWVLASKGIDDETKRLPSHILYHALEKQVPFVVLAGPSFADELAKAQPTAVMLASNELDLASRLKLLLDNDYFFSHLTKDVIGVELCGVLKNCIALAMGVLDAAGYGKNVQALVLTQAIAELTLIVEGSGGEEKTVTGLAGIGDIVLTSCGPKSRNYALGFEIGNGHYEKLDTSHAEGIKSLRAVKDLSSLIYKSGKPLFLLPLFSALYDVVFHREHPRELINACRVD